MMHWDTSPKLGRVSNCSHGKISLLNCLLDREAYAFLFKSFCQECHGKFLYEVQGKYGNTF